MAYPEKRPLADTYLNCQLVDASTASIAYVPVPSNSVLVGAYASLSAAITTADSIVTIKKGSTTLGTITLAYSGSAVGSTFTASLTGTEAARSFGAGDVLIFDNGGQSDTTSIVTFTAVMREL
jgi:hypothetical protein